LNLFGQAITLGTVDPHRPHFEATPPGIEGTTNSGSPIPAEDDAITTVLAAHGVDSPLP